MAGISPLAMSDEDFMNMPAPEMEPVVADTPVVEQGTTDAAAAAAEAIVVPEVVDIPAVVAEVIVPEDDKAKVEEGGDAETLAATQAETPVAAVVADPTVVVDPAAVVADPAITVPPVVAEEGTPPNYQEFYDQIMKPFKANGKTIDIRDPKDAIALMQMGANYTKKMQELQPHKKLLLMLQNNGLLDEGKLSFLIDVERKNPEAIKKLIKDSGVDPLDIDTTAEPAYTEGNHRISDAEVNFRTKLEDVTSAPGGSELISDIEKSWDAASKEAVWENPEILTIIQEQRETGVYGQIVAEMDRQKILGRVSASTPFLQAYKTVGDDMVKANSFVGSEKEVPAVVLAPKVLTVRTAAVGSPVTNDDKAGAAAANRVAPGKAEPLINFLSMPDEQFMKSMDNRL